MLKKLPCCIQYSGICRKVVAAEIVFFQANVIAYPVFEGHDAVYLNTADDSLEYITEKLTKNQFGPLCKIN